MADRIAAAVFALCVAVAGCLSIPDQAVAQAGGVTSQASEGKQRARVYIRRTSEPASYQPGPNDVRECRAQLVEEFRPSGTVIVPRTNCVWRRG